MQRLMLSTLAFLFAATGFSQPALSNSGAADIEAQRFALLSELQLRAPDALKLDKSLARALAQAEIADAAWTLDQE